MSDASKTYPVPADFAAKANLTPEKYREMYAASIADPEAWPHAATRPPSSGKAMTRQTLTPSPTNSSTSPSASSPMY